LIKHAKEKCLTLSSLYFARTKKMRQNPHHIYVKQKDN